VSPTNFSRVSGFSVHSSCGRRTIPARTRFDQTLPPNVSWQRLKIRTA